MSALPQVGDISPEAFFCAGVLPVSRGPYGGHSGNHSQAQPCRACSSESYEEIFCD